MFAKKIYFLDETSVHLDMVSLYGWGEKGERVVDYVPDLRFNRQSMISAVGLNGFIAPYVFRGTLDGERFKDYVDNVLALEMSKGDILILDNLSVHRKKDVLKTLINKGVQVIFLPPYSPDYNPIESAWSKIKNLLRRFKNKAEVKLETVLIELLKMVTETDILNYFRHCGYELSES